MRFRVATGVLLALVSGCGAKSGLEVDVAAPDLADPSGRCAPRTPTLLATSALRPMAVEGGRVWGSAIAPDMPVGYVEGSGAERIVATDQLAVRQIEAEAGVAFWAAAGRADGDGVVVRATAAGTTRVVSGSLSQPGALDLDGEWLTLGTWTNLPGPGDEGLGEIHRVDRDGRRASRLAQGLGMPTATARIEGELFWLDRRRQRVVRFRGSDDPQVIAELEGIRRPAVVLERGLYVGARRDVGEVVFRVEPEPSVAFAVDA